MRSIIDEIAQAEAQAEQIRQDAAVSQTRRTHCAVKLAVVLAMPSIT